MGGVELGSMTFTSKNSRRACDAILFLLFDLHQLAAMAATRGASSLMDGNHVYPTFYACYLLRSRRKPDRTYVGDPPSVNLH